MKHDLSQSYFTWSGGTESKIEKGEVDMCRALEEIAEMARQEGKSEGKMEGKLEGRIEGQENGEQIMLIKFVTMETSERKTGRRNCLELDEDRDTVTRLPCGSERSIEFSHRENEKVIKYESGTEVSRCG